MYTYLMNGLFICHMLRARDVLNTWEYKPSLKLLTINKRAKNNVYPGGSIANLECGGFPCARKFEVGHHGLEVKIKLVLATIGL